MNNLKPSQRFNAVLGITSSSQRFESVIHVLNTIVSEKVGKTDQFDYSWDREMAKLLFNIPATEILPDKRLVAFDRQLVIEAARWYVWQLFPVSEFEISADEVLYSFLT